MPTVDITDLTGNALFEALKSGAKIKKSTLPLSRLQDVASDWHNQNLVMIVHQVECQGCGAVYPYPNGNILLHQTHEKKGDHYSSIASTLKNPESELWNLQLVEQVEVFEVSVCQVCWNLKHIVELAKIKSKKPPATSVTPPPELSEVPTLPELDEGDLVNDLKLILDR